MIDFPEKLECLFEPHRYKVLWGGRGGTKSWGAARALLLLGSRRRIRVVCGREVQKSIEESVHALLKLQIAAMGLGGHYMVQDRAIIGVNGTRFVFVGLKHNINTIKSLEGADVIWVEEAESVSADSWNVLIPTIRKDPCNLYATPHPSEIWITFNPKLDSDATYRMFVLNPPPGAVVVKTNWRDNPWFPDVLRIEKDHMQATDPAMYLHVYEGETKSAIEGAVYADEIALAEKEGRIGTVPRDRMRPIDTYWDLGFGDATAIWFAQSMPDGTHRMIDYLENSGKTIEWYVIQLQQKGYMYGADWLPHDCVDLMIHQKLGGDNSRSIEMLMRNAGRQVRIAPKMSVASGINAARTIFSTCWFDRDKCTDGLQALRHYKYGPLTASGVEARAPLHDWASHGSDAYRTFGFGARTPDTQQAPPQPPPPGNEYSWMG